jgi:hypothetical protein
MGGPSAGWTYHCKPPPATKVDTRDSPSMQMGQNWWSVRRTLPAVWLHGTLLSPNSTDFSKVRVVPSDCLVKVITIRTGSLTSYVPPCGFVSLMVMLPSNCCSLGDNETRTPHSSGFCPWLYVTVIGLLTKLLTLARLSITIWIEIVTGAAFFLFWVIIKVA